MTLLWGYLGDNMTEQLDFDKINAEPKTNTLSVENENVILVRQEPQTFAENQYFSAARAIEMIDLVRNGTRDIESDNTVEQIKEGMLTEEPLTDSQKDDEYAQYLDEMENLELSPALSKNQFLFYRDYDNIDSLIPSLFKSFGLETELTVDYVEEGENGTS